MANLERVIKDLEYENEHLVRQIKEEIELIDGIQKDIRDKTSENTRLEGDIQKANVEAKGLHDQFKQNKEIVESLKSATSLLQKHSQDLQTNLKLKMEDTEKARLENEKVLDNYTKKWLRYQEQYEKHPKAKEIRKLKLEAANLDAEAKRLDEKKAYFEQAIKEYETDQGSLKQEKKDAISSIIKIAELKINADNEMKRTSTLNKQGENLNKQIVEKEKEFCVLKREIEEKKKAALEVKKQPEWVTAAQQAKIQASQSHTQMLSSANQMSASFSQMQSTSRPPVASFSQMQPALRPPMASFSQTQAPSRLPVASFNQAQPASRPTVASFSQVQPASQTSVSLPKLEVPQFSQMKPTRQMKLPQLPKFPRFQSNRISAPNPPATFQNNVPTLPKKKILHKMLTSKIRMVERPQILQKQTQPQPSPPQTLQQPQPPLPTTDNTNDISMETVYTVPLDQSSNQFLKQSGMEIEDSDFETPKSPATPMSSSSFSPGTHADQVKKLKQSPATGFMFRQSRPMYNALNTSESQISEVPTNNTFANTFSSSQQFLGFPQHNQMPSNTSTPVSKEIESIKMDTALDQAPPKVSESFTKPAAVSKDSSPSSIYPTEQASPAQFTEPANTTLSPGESSFNFDTGIDFNMKGTPSPGYNFNNGNSAEGNSSFDFGSADPATNASFSMGFDSFQMPSSPANPSTPGGFNFGTVSSTTPTNDGFNFSFAGNNNAPNTLSESSNSFSFTF